MKGLRIPVLAAALLPCLAGTALALGAARVAGGVQQRYADMSDLSADFEQTSTVVTLGRTRRKAGTIRFLKPGKMRWEYSAPDPQLIISDGSTLWFYRPGQNQVVLQDLGQAFTNQTPLLFLFGDGALGEEFSWEEKDLTVSEKGRYLLEMRPRREAPDLVALALEVRAKDYSVAATVLTDAFGNVTRLEFSGEEENQGLEEGLFTFEIPEGAEVIEP